MSHHSDKVGVAPIQDEAAPTHRKDKEQHQGATSLTSQEGQEELKEEGQCHKDSLEQQQCHRQCWGPCPYKGPCCS